MHLTIVQSRTVPADIWTPAPVAAAPLVIVKPWTVAAAVRLKARTALFPFTIVAARPP